MIIFWILTAAMIIVALLFLAPALLRQQQGMVDDRDEQNLQIARERRAELDRALADGRLSAEQHAAALREIEQALLLDIEQETHDAAQVASSSSTGHGRNAFIAIVVILPALSLLTYWSLGSPAFIGMNSANQHPTTSEQPSMPMASMDELIQRLRQRLESSTPDDVEGWFMLGRSYMSLRDYPQAIMAYERTYQLTGEEPVVMLALADAITLQQGGQMSGRPNELVSRALQLAPQNTTALWMAGMIAEQQGKPQEALRLWTKLMPLLSSVPQEQQELAQRIATLPLSPDERESAPIKKPAEIAIHVELAPALRDKLSAGDTLFVYAQAMQGPRAPVAIVRYTAEQLPLDTVLNDTHAVMAVSKLSEQQQVRLIARISPSGSAMAQPGDLYGQLENIAVASDQTVQLVIDSIYP